MVEFDRLYVEARRVLLDALCALSDHRDAVILAGAQAVYLHTGEGAVSVAPYTTDGDLALNPRELEPTPEISAIMRGAGFHALSGGSPGVWIVSVDMRGETVEIPIDLIVPMAVASSTGRRGARLEGHNDRTARKVSGIEAVLVDNAWKTIGALDRDDRRLVESRVAGPTALLIAKAHKISDRLGERTKPHRRDDKDALDVYRLMQTTPVATAAAVLPELLSDTRTQRATQAGLDLIVELFGARRAPGVEMAVRALQGSIPDARVQSVCLTFVEELQGLTR